jgi:hypothetical protein
MTRQITDKEYWTVTRKELDNSYQFRDTWKTVIDRFESRINDYYFNPIEKVKDPNKLKGEGFTILTIQCALIEMFASFKVGKIHNHRKRGNNPLFEYKGSHECFIPFLHSEPIFENHFFNNLNEPDKPFVANEFYDKVRCGLMHEARTKEEWVINAKAKYDGTETIFITQNTVTGKISVDRNILNKQLRKYFKDYLTKLSENSITGGALRRLFARKLDHLYDIPRDNFDWWQDR